MVTNYSSLILVIGRIILDTPTEWWIIMLWQLEKNLQFVDVAVVDITHGFTVAGLRFYHGSKVLPAILS
jgi:hypothetical protein